MMDWLPCIIYVSAVTAFGLYYGWRDIRDYNRRNRR